jgi:predicted transposase YdaD
MVELYKNKEKTNKEMISNYKIITGRQTETVQKHKETIKGLKEMLREEREKNGETTKEDKGSGE